jgi:hypothetical protein
VTDSPDRKVALPVPGCKTRVRVNPIERPSYTVDIRGSTATLSIEAPSFADLLLTAALAFSDFVVPIGTFQTWTARRVSAKGRNETETLSRWLDSALADWREGGFLASLVEVERSEATRAAGIFRGGCRDADAPRPASNPVEIVTGSVSVTPGEAGTPWKARFGVTLA